VTRYLPIWARNRQSVFCEDMANIYDMGEESGRTDWDGPLPALWAFGMQSQTATRLTPKKLFGWDGVWLDNDNILFLSRAVGEKEVWIYRMSTDRKNLKGLVKNARFPSVSAAREIRAKAERERALSGAILKVPAL
jgi:hypothetical protein